MKNDWQLPFFIYRNQEQSYKLFIFWLQKKYEIFTEYAV